jgi:hypothetical protein
VGVQVCVQYTQTCSPADEPFSITALSSLGSSFGTAATATPLNAETTAIAITNFRMSFPPSNPNFRRGFWLKWLQ